MNLRQAYLGISVGSKSDSNKIQLKTDTKLDPRAKSCTCLFSSLNDLAPWDWDLSSSAFLFVLPAEQREMTEEEQRNCNAGWLRRCSAVVAKIKLMPPDRPLARS